MPLKQISKMHTGRIIVATVRIGLIAIATVLSAFNGFMSLLTVLVFSSHESTRLWAAISLPATLWIAAIICYWFPRFGFAAYAVILVVSILICVYPLTQDNICGGAGYQCSDNLRFAILGGVLLLVAMVLARYSA